MATCLSVQVITKERQSQEDEAYHIEIVSARPAQGIHDNGECHFDISGHKIMIQDWQTGTVYKPGQVRNLNVVQAQVDRWVLEHD